MLWQHQYPHDVSYAAGCLSHLSYEYPNLGITKLLSEVWANPQSLPGTAITSTAETLRCQQIKTNFCQKQTSANQHLFAEQENPSVNVALLFWWWAPHQHNRITQNTTGDFNMLVGFQHIETTEGVNISANLVKAKYPFSSIKPLHRITVLMMIIMTKSSA